MIDLIHKPVNRRNRPAWAATDKQILEHLTKLPKGSMRQFKIATMYWRQNMTAKDIATVLEMTPHAVECVLNRITNSR